MWTALLALLGVFEIALRPQRAGAPSPRGELTDHVMQLLTVVAVTGPPLLALVWRTPLDPRWQALGFAATVGGLVLRAFAMRTLAGRFQLTPRAVPDAPRLVTTGPYAIVRHPGYTALLMFFVGLALIVAPPIGCVFAVPLIFGALVRIRVEEALLVREFGDEYAAYRREVRWMLVPPLH